MKTELIARVILLLICALTFVPPLEARPITTGDRPPALTPYAENDPVPKLVLKPLPEQNTSRQAVESFLAYLALGLNMTRVTTSGILLGLREGYDSAWSLMTNPKPTLEDFKAQWPNTARLSTTQIEAIDQRDYFVELERLDYVDSRWVVSYYLGTITSVKTKVGWRIERFSVYPEDLASINLGGHQAWLNDELSVDYNLGERGWNAMKGKNAALLALTMLILISTDSGSSPNQQDVWRDTDRTKAMNRLFIEAVRPQIGAALTGVYGSEISFWMERVTKVQEHRQYPDVLRAVVRVETYQGAHDPVGIDDLEFILEPAHHFHLEHVVHQPHPQSDSMIYALNARGTVRWAAQRAVAIVAHNRPTRRWL